MKKIICLLLSLTLTVLSLAVLSSCGCDAHADVAPADGICDVCEDELCKVHVDANTDGKCDECTAEVCAPHLDANLDGKCDKCTASLCATHTDANNDGKCETCGALACMPHADLDPADGTCDKCGGVLCTVHADADTNGICDICTAAVCVAHYDEENDDVCDYCGANVDVPRTPAQGIADTVLCYANSEPLMVQANGTQNFYEYDEEGKEFVAYSLGFDSTLKTGKLNNLVATVEVVHREVLDIVDANGKKKPVITTYTITDEFLQGYGRRRNAADGNTWVSGPNFAPAKGSIAINLDESLLQNVTYVEAPYNNVLTFRVAKENVEEVLGTAITTDSAVTVSITNDGAVVTGITISYGIKATGNFPKCLVTYEVKYDYSVQRIDLVA